MLRAPFVLAALAAAAVTLAACGQVSLLPQLAPYLGGPWQAFAKAHPDSCGEPFTDKDGQHVACATTTYTVLFDIDAAGNIRAYQGTPR